MSDLIKVQASTAQLFFNSEEFMRDFVSPVHCAHPFNVIIEQLGPRPETTLLIEFVRLTRRAYSHAKMLKIRITNENGLFTFNDLAKSTKNLQDFMFLLDQSYGKVAEFAINLPPLFDNPDFLGFVDLLQDYFEVATGQHRSFTSVLYQLLDQATDMLSGADPGQEESVLPTDTPLTINDGGGWSPGGAWSSGGGAKQTVTLSNRSGVPHDVPKSEQLKSRVQLPGAQQTVRVTQPTGSAGFAADPDLNVKVLDPARQLGPKPPVTHLESAGQRTLSADGSRLNEGRETKHSDGTFSREKLENFSKALPSRSITENFLREIPSCSRTIIVNTAQNFPYVNNASNNANTITGNTGTDWSYQVDYSTGQHAQNISPIHPQNTNHIPQKQPVTTSEIHDKNQRFCSSNLVS